MKIMDETCCRFGLYVSFKKTFAPLFAPANNLQETELETALNNIVDSKGNKHNITNETVFKALGCKPDSTDHNGYIPQRVAQATG